MHTPVWPESCTAQAFAASVLADGLTHLGNLPLVCKGRAEGKPTFGNMHKMLVFVDKLGQSHCW